MRRTTPTPRLAAGRASALCLVVGLATLTTVVGSVGSAGAANRGTSSWTPSEAALPDNGYNGEGPDLFHIACPEVQDCVSVGMYYAANGDEGISEGAIETLTATGSTFTEAPLPSSGTLGVLQSVSCPGSTFCVAVGSYGSDGSNTSGLIETFSDGQWTPTEAPAPAPGDGVQLAQVVCSEVGECVAIGRYLLPNGTLPGDGVIETLSDGSWTATAAPVPSKVGPTPSSQFRDLSCVTRSRVWPSEIMRIQARRSRVSSRPWPIGGGRQQKHPCLSGRLWRTSRPFSTESPVCRLFPVSPSVSTARLLWRS